MEDYTKYLTSIKYPINYNRPKLKYGDEVHRGLALGLVAVRPLNWKNGEKHRQCCALKWKKYQTCMAILS